MRVLVTGGFGYLGGRYAQYASQQPGVQVVIGSRRAVAPPRWAPGAATAQTDWDSAASLEKACAGADAVVHLAGMSAQDSAARPAAALAFNGEGTARLVSAAAKQGVGKFLYLSTAHVYGNLLAGTIDEKTEPVSTHPYATSHLAGEYAVRDEVRRGRMSGLVIRLSNSFGAPVRADADCWTLLINDLSRQAVVAGAIRLRSSGLARRDFIPVSEACRAIHHLLGSIEMVPETVNVGGKWAPTVREAAHVVQSRCVSVLGFRPDMFHPAPEEGEASNDLDYRIDLLEQSGFSVATVHEREIDALLSFCQREFALAPGSAP